MKVALVHDHLMQEGGAEKVLEVLAEMFPQAPIYTLMYDQKLIDKYFPGRRIEASIVQRIPGGRKFYRWFMPFMPMAVEFFDLESFEVVISDSSSFAKGVITSPDTLHICYCHTPTRYIWSDTHQYINELKYNKYFKKIISLVLNYIRIWDRLAADRADVFLTNSKTSRRRIRKYYKREAEIVYPSIEEDKFNISENYKDYFLAGCRLVPYKRIDQVVKAFKENGLKLKIFGEGLDLDRLKEIAQEATNIEFLGRVSDEERGKLYAECLAYINPQKEDFGITMVEAMASGRPVIALAQGGALETVIPNKTGILYPKETVAALSRAIEEFRSQSFDPQTIRQHALQFSTENFKARINSIILREHKKHIAIN